MKGIIFNILEQCVEREHGEETWDKLLESSDLRGSYTSLGSYPDSQLYSLVRAASEMLGVAGDAVVRWFGKVACPIFAQWYEHFFAAHSDTRSFLFTLNDIIHPEVCKLYPGAEVPHFDFDNDEDGSLLVSYFSRRKLCSLAIGLMEGAAQWYGEDIHIEHVQCAKSGHQHCILRVRVSKDK